MFSPATSWTQGQRDPARLPQQGRQRLADAAGRVLAPGSQLPGRGTLSSPEHQASDSTPTPTFRNTGWRGRKEDEWDQVPHDPSTRQQHQPGTHGSHAARPKAPTRPMGHSESDQPSLAQWQPGDTLKPGLAQLQALGHRLWQDNSAGVPRSRQCACPNGRAGHSPQGQPEAALYVHHHHPKVHSIPPAHFQNCPEACSSSARQRDSQGLGAPTQRCPSWQCQGCSRSPTSAPLSLWSGTCEGIYWSRHR